MLVQLVNGLPLFESAWVAFRLGAVWVPVNYRLTPAEVAYIAQSSGASLMLTQHAFDAHAAAAQAESPALGQLIRVDDPGYEDMAAPCAGTPSSTVGE